MELEKLTQGERITIPAGAKGYCERGEETGEPNPVTIRNKITESLLSIQNSENSNQIYEEIKNIKKISSTHEPKPIDFSREITGEIIHVDPEKKYIQVLTKEYDQPIKYSFDEFLRE